MNILRKSITPKVGTLKSIKIYNLVENLIKTKSKKTQAANIRNIKGVGLENILNFTKSTL